MSKHCLLLVICLLAWDFSFGQETTIPRLEYPRPQFERADWTNLNGEWSYVFDFGNSGKQRGFTKSEGFDGKIIVPFCPESKLSGVEYKDFIKNMWYHRKITVPSDWDGKKIRLNFGAVDYMCEAYINGQIVGRHFGGTSSFSFDLTDFVKAGQEYNLVLYVEDDILSNQQAGGKQCHAFNSEGCLYTRTTGIWQTVWMEAVAKNGLVNCHIIPDLDQKKFDVIPRFFSIEKGDQLRITLKMNGKKVTSKTVPSVNGAICTLPLKKVKTWSPQDPFLYDIVFEVLNSKGNVVDVVKSYAGMRKIHIEGYKVFLNNKPFYQRLVLDQGFYPDGLWTAPSDDALKNDIKLSMEAGFNGARLHQKVFEERFHYWADKLGYVTWGESSSWGMDANDRVTARNFMSEWNEIVERDRNHPSIIIWTPFNETAWTINGDTRDNAEKRVQHDRLITDVYNLTKNLDATRPINDASGYIHIKTDIWTSHCYEQDPEKLKERLSSTPNGKPYTMFTKTSCNYNGEPFMIDEFGGIKWNPKQQDNSGGSWGYGAPPKSKEELYKRLEGQVNSVLSLKNCYGYCYTQLTDVEQEQNGIYFYSRDKKFDMSKIKGIFLKEPDWFKKEK